MAREKAERFKAIAQKAREMQKGQRPCSESWNMYEWQENERGSD